MQKIKCGATGCGTNPPMAADRIHPVIPAWKGPVLQEEPLWDQVFNLPPAQTQPGISKWSLLGSRPCGAQRGAGNEHGAGMASGWPSQHMVQDAPQGPSPHSVNPEGFPALPGVVGSRARNFPALCLAFCTCKIGIKVLPFPNAFVSKMLFNINYRFIFYILHMIDCMGAFLNVK